MQQPAEPTPLPNADILALSTSLASLGKDLKPGESVRVKIEGEKLVEVSKEGPDRWAGFKRVVSDVVVSTGQVLKEDPSFAFREAVEIGRQRILTDRHPGVASKVMGGLVPAVRGVALLLDMHKAINTHNNPDAPLTAKVVDYGHVATDVLGLIGSLHHVVPALASVPGMEALAVTGVIGDIVAFGFHSLDYFQKTSQGSTEQPGDGGQISVKIHLPSQGE